MKKAFFVFLAFSLTSCLTSCTSKTYNTFYNQDTLSNYELTSEFPKRKSEKTCLKGEVNYFLYLDDKDYEDYSKEIYEYLCVNNYSYVGTYKQQGLVAEMLPNYCFLTIDESYDFTYSLHRFIYSTSKDIYNEGDFINPCYLITIERVEKTKKTGLVLIPIILLLDLEVYL